MNHPAEGEATRAPVDMLAGRRTSVRRAVVLYAILFAAALAPPGVSPWSSAIAQADAIWLSIDTRTLTLHVMRGSSILRSYDNIAIGSNGTTWDKQILDEKTPLGDFKISEIRSSKRFHLFLAIDYPTMDHAQRALRAKRISAREYDSLREAWSHGQAPPQDTGLGGHLGIHGIGSGSMAIHSKINWTNGCIAVTNEQVEELAGWVDVGTRVVIHQQPADDLPAATVRVEK